MQKDFEYVFSERRKARASRGVRGHAPSENFENLGLLECISCILGMNKAIRTDHRDH